MVEFSAGLQDTARGKVCDFAFPTSSGGKFYKFFMTIGLAIPPITVKNRGDALICDLVLNRANTVYMYIYTHTLISIYTL